MEQCPAEHDRAGDGEDPCDYATHDKQLCHGCADAQYEEAPEWGRCFRRIMRPCCWSHGGNLAAAPRMAGRRSRQRKALAHEIELERQLERGNAMLWR